MPTATTRRTRRGVWWAAWAVGLGLIAAPAVFQMFDRAPKGGDMIAAFEPYMTPGEIEKFQGYLAGIDTAVTEAQEDLVPAATGEGGDPLVDAPTVAALSGTNDAETGDFVLEWQSQIEGGAFNEFTGVWHLEGTFSPA